MKRNLVSTGLALSAVLMGMGCTAADVQDELAVADVVQSVGGELVIYDDALAAGWGDWSWDTSLDLAATSPVQSGSNAMAVSLKNRIVMPAMFTKYASAFGEMTQE